MSEILWETTVDYVGDLAVELIEGGCLILFGHPVPDALAEVSLVHGSRAHASSELRAGDILTIDGVDFSMDEVGSLATTNLNDLGHVVIYVNSPDQQILPGAIKATGAALPRPGVGSTVSIRRQV